MNSRPRHKDEIVHFARHREEQEEAEHPLHLIQDIEEQDASSSVDLCQSRYARIGVLSFACGSPGAPAKRRVPASLSLVGDRRSAMRADQDIRRDLERQLEWEPSIDPSEIGVSVKDGVATLSGFVHSFLEKIDAERAAKRVVGVVGLANDIEVRPRDQRTDGEVAQAAVEALKQHTSIPQGKVRPVVKNGIVTLEGEVEWQFQREAALALVRGLRGVKYATDQIQLKPTARPSPSEIKTKIEDALKRSAQVDARKITVAMTDGTVTLKGSVRSYWEREEAETAAWAAPGVTRVDNRIEVAYEYADYDYE